jgi:hypothetical protein
MNYISEERKRQFIEQIIGNDLEQMRIQERSGYWDDDTAQEKRTLISSQAVVRQVMEDAVFTTHPRDYCRMCIQRLEQNARGLNTLERNYVLGIISKLKYYAR